MGLKILYFKVKTLGNLSLIDNAIEKIHVHMN